VSTLRDPTDGRSPSPGPRAPGRRQCVLLLAKGLGRGGAERLLVESVRRLDRSRFEVEVAYLLPWKDAFVPDLEAMGVRVTCLGARNDLDARWVLSLRRLLQSRRFDLVHAQMPVPAVALRLLCWRAPVRIVYTEHNLWSRYRFMTRWANAITYGRNDAVIAVSAAVAESIRPVGHRGPPVEVIVHGPDVDAIPCGAKARAAARLLLDLPEHALVIGTVGNFTPKKDHVTLLESVTALPAQIQPTVVLVGSGPLEDEVATTARRLGLHDRVRLLGTRSDVYDLLPAFDVFAMSSRFEGLPIALLEAMSAGLAVVATAVGGIPEVVTTGTEGILVPAGDVAAFSEALATVLETPELRRAMGDAARARAASFDLGLAVHQTEGVYARVLKVAP